MPSKLFAFALVAASCCRCAAVPLAGVAVLLLLSLCFHSFLLRLFLHSRNYEIKRGVAGSLLIAAAGGGGGGGGAAAAAAAVTAILQLTK